MKQKLITLSSPVAVRDGHTTYLVTVVEGFRNVIDNLTFELRINKVYDNAAKHMIALAHTASVEVKKTNIRSIQEL